MKHGVSGGGGDATASFSRVSQWQQYQRHLLECLRFSLISFPALKKTLKSSRKGEEAVGSTAVVLPVTGDFGCLTNNSQTSSL